MRFVRPSLPSSLLVGTLVLAGLLLGPGPLPAIGAGKPSGKGYVTVHLASVTRHLGSYGQVEPIALVRVNAPETGVVEGLRILPGMAIHAGEKLADLKGPGIESLILQGQADVRSASAQLTAAQKTLRIQQQQLISHLSTRKAVHQAQSAVAQAQMNLDNARSRLAAVRQMKTVSAPADATVLTLNTANGEFVRAGQTLLTLQKTNRLWLRASYYGADLAAIRVGMEGLFVPADGEPSIPVRVQAFLGPMTAGGGESIGLVPAIPRFHWRNGEFGRLRLNLPPRKLVVVPTRALILDHGTWWVLVHTPTGNHPQAVVPGPSREWQTFLKSGLKPGTQVVVENAYLLFHREIATRYQLPD